MKGTLTTINPDGSRNIVQYRNRTIPLEDLKTAVGGHIEVVPAFNCFQDKFCVAFCNEDGKNMDLAYNTVATGLWLIQCPVLDYLAGPIAIVQGDEEFMKEL